MSIEEDSAPGWDAIDTALEAVYANQEPLHWAPRLPAELGGNDPLQGISAYRSSFGGTAHWHFVTYGFSELYEKESDDPEASGYGFEMTIRVVDPEAGDEPPRWVFSLLQNLARYVFKSGNAFGVGHHTNLNGPIALGRKTLLVRAAFVGDPQLPSIRTPNGELVFLQLVGITADEYEAILDWDTSQVLSLVARKDPALLTTLSRRSFLEDEELRRQVVAGAAREGSSMSLTFSMRGAPPASVSTPVLEIAANALDNLKRFVRGRLEFGRPATIAWQKGAATLSAHSTTSVVIEEGEPAQFSLSPEDRAAILKIPVARGDYPLPSGCVVRVIQIEILDGQRKKVIEVIG